MRDLKAYVKLIYETTLNLYDHEKLYVENTIAAKHNYEHDINLTAKFAYENIPRIEKNIGNEPT